MADGSCCRVVDTCPTHACPHHEVSCPNYVSRADYGWPETKAEATAAVERAKQTERICR